MHRTFSRLLALGSLLLAAAALPALGCGDDGGAATAITLSLKTDLAAGTEYTSVRVAVYASTDKSLKSPLSEHELRAGQLSRPIVINAAGQSAVLVKVTAIGTNGGAPVVVELLKASFTQGKTQVLEVFVSAACAEVACSAGDTCLGQKTGAQCEGSCADIPEPDLRQLTQAGEEDAWRPVLCGSDGGTGDAGRPDAGLPDGGRPDAGNDAATSCTTTLPGAPCDLVSQCGCAPGEQCVLEQVSPAVFTPTCVADASGGTPFGICDTDLDCPPSYGCVNPGLCLPYCNSIADCPDDVPSSCDALGNGSGSTLAGVRICALTCSSDSDCVSPDQFCSTTEKCVPRPDLGEACDARSDCLEGGICIVEGSATVGTCLFECVSNSECLSGCCITLSDGSQICGEASECGPVPPGPAPAP
jgi:hypothetical protein